MKTYCCKFYHSKRNNELHRQTDAAGLIWNHCIALHRRYYKLFSPPKFKKIHKYKSFTLKQAGWKLDESMHILTIKNQVYRYFDSRRISGKVKTVTIKRDSLRDIYIYVVTDATDFKVETRTGKSVGFDFGLKKFLTISDGKLETSYQPPATRIRFSVQ